MGDFSYNKRFILRWEIFPFMEDFSYIPWEISLAKRNHVGQAQRKIVHYERFYSPGEILFAMGDKIYPWMFNLGRYIS